MLDRSFWDGASVAVDLIDASLVIKTRRLNSGLKITLWLRVDLMMVKNQDW